MRRLLAAAVIVVTGTLIGGGLGFVTAPDDDPEKVSVPSTPVTFPPTTTTTTWVAPEPEPYVEPTPEPPPDEWGGMSEYLEELIAELEQLRQDHHVEADDAGPRGQEDPGKQGHDDPLGSSLSPGEFPLPLGDDCPVEVPLPVIKHGGHPSRCE